MRKLTRALVAALAVAIVLPSAAVAYWPVGTRSSYISQWSSSQHRALDIAAPYGTKVVPIRSGKTIFAGWKNNCGGYQVWVSHGNGLYSAYYHLRSESSYAGEPVTGGSETIGYVGTSGCVTGSHVHVEVWKGYPWRSGSYRVNPYAYVDDGYYLPYRYR